MLQYVKPGVRITQHTQHFSMVYMYNFSVTFHVQLIWILSPSYRKQKKIMGYITIYVLELVYDLAAEL